MLYPEDMTAARDHRTSLGGGSGSGRGGGRPRIRVLPPELASQIAAGEVVERPSSVVKELVENALDAGARRVDVAVDRGGRERIRVVDDGCGLTADEVGLALERHATSKLRQLEDLTAIDTLGFRGEALPSIASVSRLAVTSRPQDEVVGARSEVSAGGPAVLREVGCPVGTTVEVTDLFFNVPARLKFLKTDRTESAHVGETLLLVALSRPEVHFTLTEDGRRTLDLPRHPGLGERAAAALGRRGAGLLHYARAERDGMVVEAALGSPLGAVATAKNVYLLVNGRGVRDRLLLRMLSLGYGELLERGRYPLCVLHLRVPLGAVDVNVHPQKYEVRFLDEARVASMVRRSVAEGVTRAPWASAAGVGALHTDPRYGAGSPVDPAPGAVPRDASALGGDVSAGGAPGTAVRSYALRSPPLSAPGGAVEMQPGALGNGLHGRLGEAPGAYGRGQSERHRGTESLWRPGLEEGSLAGLGVSGASVPEGSLQRHRYLGQLFRTYLLLEGDGELILVDQHAAHERITFGHLKAALGGGEVKMQRLLFPQRVTLEPPEEALLEEHRQTLHRCGFEVELLSGHTAAVRGVPALLAEGDVERLFRDVLAELGGISSTESLDRALDLLLATMACHASVRAGQWLGEAEVAALLAALDQTERSGHCPHGRPVVVRLSEPELRRRFQRE